MPNEVSRSLLRNERITILAQTLAYRAFVNDLARLEPQ